MTEITPNTLSSRQRGKVLGVIVVRDSCNFATAREKLAIMSDEDKLMLLDSIPKLTRIQRAHILAEIVACNNCDYTRAKEVCTNMSDEERMDLLKNCQFPIVPLSRYKIKCKLERVAKKLNIIGISAFLSESDKGTPRLEIDTKAGLDIRVVYYAKKNSFKLFATTTSSEIEDIVVAIDSILS